MPQAARLRVAFADDENQVISTDFEELTHCRYTARNILEKECSMEFWAMPPPAAPSIPFGGIPSSESAGCSHQLATAEWPLLSQLVVKHAGVAGLGVFASGSIESGLAVCEYTGMLRVDPPSDDFDAYAFSLPIVDPLVVISARSIGGLARLINHSDEPNARLQTVYHGDASQRDPSQLHVVCFTLKPIAAGEQILINYGKQYWKAYGRRPIDFSEPATKRPREETLHVKWH